MGRGGGDDEEEWLGKRGRGKGAARRSINKPNIGHQRARRTQASSDIRAGHVIKSEAEKREGEKEGERKNTV